MLRLKPPTSSVHGAGIALGALLLTNRVRKIKNGPIDLNWVFSTPIDRAPHPCDAQSDRLLETDLGRGAHDAELIVDCAFSFDFGKDA